MKNNKDLKLSNTIFNIDYENKENILLSNQKTLRKLVGILGMLLPFLLYLFLYIDTKYSKPLESISHYYFTRVGSLFVAILCLLSIFLIIYKGKAIADFYVSTIAGACALCAILFPTNNLANSCCDKTKFYAVTFLKNNTFRESFHLITSTVFLLSLAYMSFFIFTKTNVTNNNIGNQKKTRNVIYRTCGIIMVLALLVILARFLNLIPINFYNNNHLTFWMETIAVESFGFSWLIKGETFFKDVTSDN